MTRTLRKRAKIESAFDVVADLQQLLQMSASAYAPALPSPSPAAMNNVAQNLRGLPKHLIEYIFDQQVGYKGAIYYASHIPHAPTCIGTTMPELAMVSKGWFKVISQMVEDFEAANGVFYFKDGSQYEISAFYAFMEQRGSQLTNLSISLSFGPQDWRLVLSLWAVHLPRIDALEIDWDRAFRHCPKLLRLDLRPMLLHSRHLGAVLAAASTHCPHVQSLILPKNELWKVDPVKVQPNLAELYKAMERWYKGNLNRGLLQLTVPHRLYPNDEDLSYMGQTDEYLNAIAAHCSNLEYFDGGRATNDMYREYSEEMLFCSLDAWDNFCRSCTRFREFDWLSAPLDDRYLEIFGKYPKPQLRRMYLASGSEDHWPYEWHSGQYLDPNGFKLSTRSLGVMLSACPALTRIDIEISHLSKRLKQMKNRFNDDFFVAVAQHCKHLNSLHFESDVCRNKPPTRIGDEGLAALATLPRLCTIRRLDAPHASSQGVFDLLVKTPSARDRREFSLTFGTPRSRDGGAFFGLVSVLLEKLARLPADTLHIEHNIVAKLMIPYKFSMRKHKLVKMRLEACVQQFTLRFPHCALSFSISETDSWGLHWKYDKYGNVPDDLTEIYCVSIDTRGNERQY